MSKDVPCDEGQCSCSNSGGESLEVVSEIHAIVTKQEITAAEEALRKPVLDGERQVAELQHTIASLEAELHDCHDRSEQLDHENSALRGRLRELEVQIEHADGASSSNGPEREKDAMHEFFHMTHLSLVMQLPFERRVQLKDAEELYAEACRAEVPMWEWHDWISASVYGTTQREDSSPRSNAKKRFSFAQLKNWSCSEVRGCPMDGQSVRRTLGLDESASPPIGPYPFAVGGNQAPESGFGGNPSRVPSTETAKVEEIEDDGDTYVAAIQEDDAADGEGERSLL